MEILLLVVLLIILFVVLNRVGESNRAIDRLRQDVHSLQEELANFARAASTVRPAEISTVLQSKPVASPVAKEEPVKRIIREWPPVEQMAEIEEAKPPFTEKPIEAQTETVIAEPTVAEAPYIPEAQPSYTPPEPTETWSEKWLRDNPDIEKFIGENLINKIGIGILVLGIGFFVKYAIDQDWIKEIGRVFIGLFCGAVLIALAHRLRKNYHSFSSVLAGGGLAVFYFTVALAFHAYSIPLFNQTGSFVSMVIITIFAVALSVLYNRMELAIIAAVGGFLTPFLVSNGQGNYMVLFTYLAILNAGLIALAWYKRWRALNFIAFVFTQVIYLGWILNGGTGAPDAYRDTFVFGCIFYAMFITMNVIHHVGRGSKLKAFDFIILLSVNLCFYGAGTICLTDWGAGDYKGLFTAVLGVVNLAMGWLFFKRTKADKNFIYLIIGVTVTYISLAAPVQLQGHYITMFWAAESVILLWLYQRSFIKLLKTASSLVTLLMLASLLMDWVNVYDQILDTGGVQPLAVIANKGFITGIICTVAVYVLYAMLRREADTYYLPGFTNKFVRLVYLLIALVLLFSTGLLEVNFQFGNRFPATGLKYIYLQLYIATFFACMFMVLRRFNVVVSVAVRLGLPFILFGLYVINIRNVYLTEKQMLSTGNYKPHFAALWVSIIMLLVLANGTIKYVRQSGPVFKKILGSFTWIITIALLVVFSIEIRHLIVWLYYSGNGSIAYAENLYSKAGLSIVWGLSSFVIIWLGLSKKYKPLRVIALVVFGITLIKLFAYDIQNIPPAGKIAAFILLGVVLLVVSFMYQRLKKLIIDDAHNTP